MANADRGDRSSDPQRKSVLLLGDFAFFGLFLLRFLQDDFQHADFGKPERAAAFGPLFRFLKFLDPFGPCEDASISGHTGFASEAFVNRHRSTLESE